MLAHFPEINVALFHAERPWKHFVTANPINCTLVARDETRVAVLFAAWNGTNRQLQTTRYGNYLGPLVVIARRLVEQGVKLGGMLEIDAYVGDNADPKLQAELSMMSSRWTSSTPTYPVTWSAVSTKQPTHSRTSRC